MDQATAFRRLREAKLREQRPYYELEAEARARVHARLASDNRVSRP